jgi:F-type H+-transporting ATPase subunit b
MASPPKAESVSGFTGNTGVAVATAGGMAVLVSQEILILHAETVTGICMAGVLGGLYKYAGAGIAETLDEPGVSIASSLNAAKIAKAASLEEAIEAEKQIPSTLEHLQELYSINKELEVLNREQAFRDEKHAAAAAVIAELDLMVKTENEVKLAEQGLLIDKVVAGVLGDIEKVEGEILKQCVADLAKLSAEQ